MSRRLSGSSARDLARRALRARPVAGAIRAFAGVRGRGLVLLYHRVVPEPPTAATIVPWVSAELFRRHVDALGNVGELVPLEALADGTGPHVRPRFAVTFDDDYATHVEHALPILRALGVPATFFLSGRGLRGLGPYWFEILERAIGAQGLASVARLLGVVAAGPDALALACERDRSLQARLEGESGGSGLGSAGIEALGAGGMGVGFHTLRHRILPPMPDDELEVELTDGREDIEAVLGRRLVFFAYPHGKGDRRTAEKVRRAGYRAAFTGRPRPVGRDDDRFLLGRWEPGPLGVDDLLVGTAIRLAREAPR